MCRRSQADVNEDKVIIAEAVGTVKMLVAAELKFWEV